LKPDLGTGIWSVMNELDPPKLSNEWPHTISFGGL
jgi:hypothetical protein